MDFVQGQAPRRRRADKVKHRVWQVYRVTGAVIIVVMVVLHLVHS
jgi:hypothetical protein